MSTSDIVAVIAVVLGCCMTALFLALGYLIKRTIDSWDDAIKEIHLNIGRLNSLTSKLSQSMTEIALRVEHIEKGLQ